MWVVFWTILLMSTSIAQAQEPLDFEGADIQGELQQADLTTLGQRTPWVIPVPLKPPQTMRHHMCLAPVLPVLSPTPEPPPEPAPKRKKKVRHGSR